MVTMRGLVGPIADIRPMPIDYWPSVTVQSKDGAIELGFMFSQEEWDDGLVPGLFAKRLDALRYSMWQFTEMTRLGIPIPSGVLKPAD